MVTPILHESDMSLFSCCTP